MKLCFKNKTHAAAYFNYYYYESKKQVLHGKVLHGKSYHKRFPELSSDLMLKTDKTLTNHNGLFAFGQTIMYIISLFVDM